jgi:hypothetical protein
MKHLLELKCACQNYLLDNHNKKDAELQQVKDLLVAIKNRINQICNHQFEYDMIEVGEVTKTVCYCIVCGENN